MQTAQQLKKHKARLKRQMTKGERAFEIILKTNGIKYKKQMILGFYILDFVLPDYMLNIEVDGLYHSERKKEDYLRDNFCRDCGYSVIRIKNEDVISFDIVDFLKDFHCFPMTVFRSSLGIANAKRGKVLNKKISLDELL